MKMIIVVIVALIGLMLPVSVYMKRETDDRHQFAFQHGQKCKSAGIPVSANPYTGSDATGMSGRWLDGWIQGQDSGKAELAESIERTLIDHISKNLPTQEARE